MARYERALTRLRRQDELDWVELAAWARALQVDFGRPSSDDGLRNSRDVRYGDDGGCRSGARPSCVRLVDRASVSAPGCAVPPHAAKNNHGHRWRLPLEVSACLLNRIQITDKNVARGHFWDPGHQLHTAADGLDTVCTP